MCVSVDSNVFDILALLCSMLLLEEERECAILWKTATDDNIIKYISDYKAFLEIVQRVSISKEKLTDGEIEYINSLLNDFQSDHENKKSYIYLLAREVEHRLEPYSQWSTEAVFYQVEPLNCNYQETGIIVYPHTKPQWDMHKSERERRWNFNASFCNYMIIRQRDVSPFEIVMHYWNDTGLLRIIDDGWCLPVAISPVADNVQFKSQEKAIEQGKTICIDGLSDEESVNQRVMQIFDEVFKENYSIIVFPEMLGSITIMKEVKKRMRGNPDMVTIVLLPTICESGDNTLIVLGPGGVECLRQNKLSPFILLDNENGQKREELECDNKIHLINTQELGIVVFPICADLLDPDYYRVITDVAMVDSIICPSCSPGLNAFIETINKGLPLKILQIYLNTCSAKNVSRNGRLSDIMGIVQLPNSLGTRNEFLKKKCEDVCAAEYCYFDINIVYQDRVFTIGHFISTVNVHKKEGVIKLTKEDLISFFDTEPKEIKKKNKDMLDMLMSYINSSGFRELDELYKKNKYIRYSAKDYFDEAEIPDLEKEIFTSIGYTNALLDVMQLYTQQKFEYYEIQRINTKYKYDILRILADKGTVLHKDLASFLGVSISGLTAVIQRMNATSVKMVNVEEISKYKLYSLTAQAYKYYIQNVFDEPNESSKQDNKKLILIYEDGENGFVERKVDIEKNYVWKNEIQSRLETLKQKRVDKFIGSIYNLKYEDVCHGKNRTA